MTKYPIPTHLQDELMALNKAVEDAVKIRTQWLDSHMNEVSLVKVGDDVYNLDTGTQVGVVSRLYRYHANKDWRYDTSLSVECEFSIGNNCYDNTSRQPFKIGTKDQLKLRLERKIKNLL